MCWFVFCMCVVLSERSPSVYAHFYHWWCVILPFLFFSGGEAVIVTSKVEAKFSATVTKQLFVVGADFCQHYRGFALRGHLPAMGRAAFL